MLISRGKTNYKNIQKLKALSSVNLDSILPLKKIFFKACWMSFNKDVHLQNYDKAVTDIFDISSQLYTYVYVGVLIFKNIYAWSAKNNNLNKIHNTFCLICLKTDVF